MLDIKYIKENPEEVIARLQKKGKEAREECLQEQITQARKSKEA